MLAAPKLVRKVSLAEFLFEIRPCHDSTKMCAWQVPFRDVHFTVVGYRLVQKKCPSVSITRLDCCLKN